MHDPDTVAHEIRFPWWNVKPWPRNMRKSPRRADQWNRMTTQQRKGRSPHWPDGYRDHFITVWHHDPCAGGSEDSCGFSWVRLSPYKMERLRKAAWQEAHNPHFLCCSKEHWDGTAMEAEFLHRGLVLWVCRVLGIKISFDEVCTYACQAIHHVDTGKPGDQFCFLPGYHTNSAKDSKEEREEHFLTLMVSVAVHILTDRRPWWKHPRWHFWHWKIQCHPLLKFKRWAFSRCCKCGKRFAWGYSPVSDSWHCTGPRWFKSEIAVHHCCCERPNDDCVQSAESEPVNS